LNGFIAVELSGKRMMRPRGSGGGTYS